MDQTTLILVLIGLGAGIGSGLFGIGGGVVIVPCLVMLLGFSQHRATGTSIAVLLPPIGLAAAMQYYKSGNVDWRAAILVAISLFFGAWVGAIIANKLSGPVLRCMFGIFIIGLGIHSIRSSYVKIQEARRDGTFYWFQKPAEK